MSQANPSGKNKKVKALNYINAGSLKSLVDRKISTLTTRKDVQPMRSTKELRLGFIEKQQRPMLGAHMQRESTPVAAPSVQKQVHKMPFHSTTHVTELGQEQVQPDSLTQATQPVQEQVHVDSTTSIGDEQSAGQGPSIQKRKRGKTQMRSVHGRVERKLIVLNHLNQPVGPTDAVVIELGSFCGTLARNARLCPVNIIDWRKLDTKDDLWKYTKEKYDIPDDGKEWIFEAIKTAWRRHKCRLKKAHYKAYENDQLRMENRPQYIPESQFKELLKHWNSEPAQKTSDTNSRNRKKLKHPHTVGRTSFALIRSELEKQKGTSDSVSLKEMFVATRKRKPGRVYKESDEDTISKIAEMEKIQNQESEDDGQSIDPFASVMGPEHPGRLRLYGRGVTRTALKGKVGQSGPFSNAIDEKMDKKMEEMEERIQRRMQEQFELQKAAMRQEFVGDFITEIQRVRPGLLDDDLLATLRGRSLGEASSSQQAIQQINRQSTDSNNPGGVNGFMEDELSDDDLT